MPRLASRSRGQDGLLDAGVDGGGGVVEDEQLGLADHARAKAIRWRWPPERLAPRSPTRVSSPAGSVSTKPVALRDAQGAPRRLVVVRSAPSVTLPRTRVVEHEGLLRHERGRRR